MPKNSSSHYLEKRKAAKREKMQRRIAAGLISDHFTDVLHIIIRLTYYQKGMADPMVRTVNFAPGDYAYFNMECMRRECLNGGFDLTQKISCLFKNHKRVGRGKKYCSGQQGILASCNACIDYKIIIRYNTNKKMLA